MLKVSFVVTVYNKEAFLPGVIAALCEQSGAFEREFVFINDGSTDRSWDVVKAETADLENVVLIEQNNQGVAIATNNAVAAATGDLIKLVDSDDILAPFCTSLLLDVMDRTGADFVFGYSGEHTRPPEFQEPDDLDIVEFDDPLFSVIDRGFARVSHSLFAKALFDQAQGCDERVFSQDHSLFIRLASKGRMAQVRHYVCSSPADEPGRIMNNEAQVVHDATLALAYHLDENVEVTPKHFRVAQDKIMARVWRWAKKHHGASILSMEFLLYLLCKAGGKLSKTTLIELCAIFRKGASVRRPAP